jgi:hypothetical protein
MKIEIAKILDRGVANKERLWLKVLADTDLRFFIVLDTTYTTDSSVSNLQRHAHWFRSNPVRAGDWVVLYTGPGKPAQTVNPDGTTRYFLHWGLEKTIWNATADCAVLMEITSWQTSRQGE